MKHSHFPGDLVWVSLERLKMFQVGAGTRQLCVVYGCRGSAFVQWYGVLFSESAGVSRTPVFDYELSPAT